MKSIKNIIESTSLNDVHSIRENKESVLNIIENLDKGSLRISEKKSSQWITHSWIKKAILMYFILQDSNIIHINGVKNYDKIPLKFSDWSLEDFKRSRIRSVPGSIVRKGTYIGQDSVLMPSFVNIGAYIDSGTMIDTWATIGSCAQIGKKCHISGGVGIGGVLEPLNNNPVIIEDDCFIGARSEIAEGIIIRQGSVIGTGVYITSSTKIIHRKTGKISYGEIPPYSVVVSGSYSSNNQQPYLYACVIVKEVDENTKKKTSINELLRE